MENETTKSSTNVSVLEDYRLTRLQHPAPQLGQPNVKASDDEWTELIKYQCAGKDYQAYIRKIAQMANAKQSMGDLNWGRREAWVPANKTILILGTSHTLQVAIALAWQFKEQITSYRWTDWGVYGLVQTYQNGAVVYIISNCPSVYSPRWQTNLEEGMGILFSELDAIALGPIHTYDPTFYDSIMWTRNREFAETHPTHLINVTQNPNGPTISDLTDVYAGNLIYLPSFQTHMDEYQKSISLASQRTNMRVLHSQLFIEATGGESCGHKKSGVQVSACHVKQDGHQCIGSHGGIPDVFAWDFTEILLDLFGEG